jgi:hypothetical protein
MQIIDADHVLERLDQAERSFRLNPYPIRLVCIPIHCIVSCTQTHCIVRPGGTEAMPCFKSSAFIQMARR